MRRYADAAGPQNLHRRTGRGRRGKSLATTPLDRSEVTYWGPGITASAEVLTPVFIKWMRARTAEPGDALVALRRTSRIGDDTVWPHLVWGLRHVDESVQLDYAD